MAQQDTTFELSLGDGAHASGLTVEEMRLSEAISRPYSCQVRFIANAALTPANVIGKGASLKITRGTGSTEVRGVTVSFARHDKSSGNKYVYTATIAPKLSLLDLNHQNKVYGADAAVKITDLIEKVCGTKVSYNKSKVAGNSYPARDFVVQHNESDLNFLMRQCENYGVYFYFDTTDTSGEKILFEDSNAFKSLKTVNNDNKLKYGHGRKLDSSKVPIIRRFAQTARVAPGQVRVRDYNPNQPSLEMKKDGPVANGLSDYVRMEYGANFIDIDKDGKLLADVRGEELGWQGQVFEGVCNIPSARAGFIFELVENTDFNGSYIIVSAEHRVATPAPAGQGAPGIEARDYRVAFKCIASNTKFRPPRITPKPEAAGLLTAKVDGEANSAIAQMDDKGRYKVRFHLDAGGDAALQEKASEYVRRAGEYAGPGGTGMHLPMLRDTEVVLACLNGDIDRPVIIGAVPNGSNPNVVTNSNAIANILTTPSGSLVEMNDGTTAGTSTTTYKPFVRLAAPAAKSDIAAGSYFRLGAFISAEESARAPSQASGLTYTKHTVSSTTNPAPDTPERNNLAGSNTQAYVDAAKKAQGTKKTASQISLNTISLVEAYNTAPSGDGIIAMTDKDFELRVDGGAVVEIGKGYHLNVNEGDYQVTVDDGAIFLSSSAGVDIRGGTAAAPANISLTAYGYIKQEAKGPVSEWSYSTKETRTYGYSKDWFYGTKYSEFHGEEEKIFYGTTKSRTYGASDSIFMGAKSSVTLGKDFSFNLAVKTSILVGGNISMEMSGYFKAVLAFGASIQVAAEYKLVAGAYLQHTFGSADTSVFGTKTENIVGLGVKNVSGVDMKIVTGVDMKKVELTIEHVNFALKNSPVNVTKETASVWLKDIGLDSGQMKITQKIMNVFP